MIRATPSFRKRLALTPVAFAVTMTFVCGEGWAQGPIEGTYRSLDIGGPMEPGRQSISWSNPGGRLALGNTVNAQSWSGTALGDQWKITCTAVSAPPVLILDTVNAQGNGYKAWQVTYAGGFVWLSAGGPWDGGGAPYNGFVDAFTTITAFQYKNNDIVSVISNLSMEATIAGFASSCFSLLVSNTVEIGTTDDEAKPSDYPAFLESNCDLTPTLGSWGDVTGLTLNLIDCSIVPVKHHTWGAIKQKYDK